MSSHSSTKSQSDYPDLGRQLFSMTWPMLFGVLSLMSFQLVDSAFIGQLGVLPLAAQGFTLPMQMVVIGLQVGLGIATTSLISRVLGADETLRAKQLGGLVVLTGAVSVFLICVLIWFLRGPILMLLSAPSDVYPVIDAYWPVWLASSWTGAMLYFAYSLCRANGNTMLPGIMMMVTSVLNMVLDPIFIFTLDMGLVGAAWATIAAFGVGLLVVYPLVLKRHWMSLNWQGLDVLVSIKELANIMAPAMLSQLLPPLSSMLATKLVAGFGAATVAAWALGSRLEFFSIVVVLALTMSMPPMVGRMLGAGEICKIKALIKLAVKFVLIWQFVIAAALFVTSPVLSHLLTSELSVSEILSVHLFWVPVSLGPLGVCMLMVSICNALALPMRALLISGLRLFVCFLPAIWLGAQLGGLEGLFVGALIGNVAAGISAWVLYQQGMKRVIVKYCREPAI
ncbi:MATE family efflux transporter [Photobacterium alginatilyticum]|uniref:Multidrug resistance protein NorM n=1 Tax=Photobacterium alginatilyticum TaxID=1775171 RepID=A0ABW9YFD5_9GAMM|nr:MATE family efflux transporter [Photobacterium alginatilyticum]NBI51996.1 MATE family efflux transporter [Photobacterium alginatilyticum]